MPTPPSLLQHYSVYTEELPLLLTAAILHIRKGKADTLQKGHKKTEAPTGLKNLRQMYQAAFGSDR